MQLIQERKDKELEDNKIKDNEKDVIKNKLKKKEEELEAMNTFIFKMQKEFEKEKEDNEANKLKIDTLQKENNLIKKQLQISSDNMPKDINVNIIKTHDEMNTKNLLDNNDIQIPSNNNSESNKNKLKYFNSTFENSEIQSDKYNSLVNKLNEANQEIKELKKKNKELLFQLEEKEVKSAFSGYKTEDVNGSNFEEEFDLKKMVNGARDKNRSEDINIDYPGIQGIKEKYNELEFRFNNLVEQVQILIGNISVSQKIKPQVSQICQLMGYSPKTTGRILSSSKDRKKIFGI